MTPEKPKQNEQAKSAPEAPKAPETRTNEPPKNVQNAIATLEEQRDEALEKVNELYNKKREDLRIQKDSIAEGHLNKMVEEQRSKIREVYNQKINKLKELKGHTAEQLSAEAEKYSETVLENLNLALTSNITGEELTPQSVYGTRQTLEAIEAMKKENPELFTIYETLIDKGHLSDEDYKVIIKSFKTEDLISALNDPKKAFEASATGAIIAKMNKSQRIEFVKHFIESDRIAETAQMIEGILLGGFLEKGDVQEHWDEAKKQKLITPEQDKRFSETDYSKKAQELQQAVQEEIQKKYGGRYSRNMFDTYIEKGLLPTIGMVWGGLVLILNALNNRKNLGSLSTNISAIAGAGAFLTGGYFGGGKFIADVVGINMEDKETEETPEVKKAKESLSKLFEKKSTLQKYFANGGYKTLNQFNSQLKSNETIDSLTIDRLISLETDQDQKNRLHILADENKTAPEVVNDSFISIFKLSKTAGFKSDEEFRKYIANHSK